MNTNSIFLIKKVKAKKEQCIGLECCIAWSYEDIERRLNNSFNNRNDSYVESIKSAEMYSYKKLSKLESQ